MKLCHVFYSVSVFLFYSLSMDILLFSLASAVSLPLPPSPSISSSLARSLSPSVFDYGNDGGSGVRDGNATKNGRRRFAVAVISHCRSFFAAISLAVCFQVHGSSIAFTLFICLFCVWFFFVSIRFSSFVCLDHDHDHAFVCL